VSSDAPLLLPAPRRLARRPGFGPALGTEPAIALDPRLPAEGFALSLDATGIRLRHADARALRYARQLLAQIQSQSGERLPALAIEDWPDFPVRGYMLDVSRDRVPTRATLALLVERMSLLRLNHLELYTEHTFAYRDHEAVWREASPITPDDVRWLDSLCRERGIELCANQNCFGHFGRWLAHADYRARAETPEGFVTRAGLRLPPSVLAPTEDNARFALVLCRELLACHSSRRIHIGCDETFELGRGASRAEAERRGVAAVYAEHLTRLLTGLHADGCEVLFWGDMLRSHPELVRELPREQAIALAWHYEAPMDPGALPESLVALVSQFGYSRELLRGFEAHVAAFSESGFPFWVCPGTSSWNSLIGRLPNALANLRDAAEVGLARGARGYLITDWGDTGHMQPPSVSLPPLVYGASVAWCLASNRDAPLAAWLDRHVFDDAEQRLGSALVRMGSLYAGPGKTAFNGSPLFTELVPGGLLGSFGAASAAGVAQTLEALAGCEAELGRARPRCADAAIIASELVAALRLARHGAWRIARTAGFERPSDAELRRDLTESIALQRDAWLARSRPGGLRDSLARLEATLASD
jgi:hypothetical protein